jgi:hypothetical protein
LLGDVCFVEWPPQSGQGGRPYGSAAWVEAVVQRLGLQATVRPRGRPRKAQARDLFAQNRGSQEPFRKRNGFLTPSISNYVESNALRANLVGRAERWRWSSLWQRCQSTRVPWLSPWPLAVPESWLAYVN